MQYIVLGWEMSSDFGWGVSGLNIFMHWAIASDVQPMTIFSITDETLRSLDPLRRARIQSAVDFNNQHADTMRQAIFKGQLKLDYPVIHAIGNRLEADYKDRLIGIKNIARTVTEITNLKSRLHNLETIDAFVCHSEWNASVLRAHSAKPVHVIHEGVDPSLFFPGPKSGLMDPNRFTIFTGGKIESRKGQDLVLLAFREFSRRHDDAMLVTLWNSPWPNISRGFKGRLDAPLQLDARGGLDLDKWLADNGIDPGKVINLGMVPNPQLPMILREMDCALQPSRAEGGTNIVVTEAMGCGLPVIFGRNSGMLDMIDGENCVPLVRQTPVEDTDGLGREGWGESDVEEILEALEKLYASAALRRTIGANAAAFIHKNQIWSQHAARLKDVVLGLL